ncbi:MAG: DUF1802 family protein [Armatimonadetes bacterium]|nr:DUF1802 family protein [Armatimonadota bacterium]
METCQTALKEWAVVVDALQRGDQILLLRKGGILDVGGEFSLEAERFCLWPTYLHQEADWLAADHQHRLAPILAQPREADAYTIASFAEVTDILAVPSREQLDALAGEHVWSSEYLDMRWRYRPELPLYLLLLRVHHLGEPVVLRETVQQRGCKSWVDLDPPVALGGLAPVLSDPDHARRRALVKSVLQVR